MLLNLTKKTDPIWKYTFKPVPVIDEKVKKMVADMQETLTFTGGVGLAAPQIGEKLRLFIVDYGALKETFINPKMIKRVKETDEGEEGCLSIPGYRGILDRATEIVLEYTDIRGKTKLATLSGFYARIVQHEYDHLSSTFYVDHIADKKENLLAFEPVRLVFFGTPEFAATILRSLIGQSTVGEYEIPLVVTAPPKLAGRKQEERVTPVEELAKQFNIALEKPSWLVKKDSSGKRIVNEEIVAKIKAAKPQVIVVASYGKILPKEILDIPVSGSLNVHGSVLPKYRGASPIQAAIAAGDLYTGVSIMKMNEKMDEGPVIISAKQRINKDDTFETLSAKLAVTGSNLINHVIHLWVNKKIKAKAQKHEQATYTKILKKEDGYVDFGNPPKNLSNLIRAYHPWPGVWTIYRIKNEELRVKLLPKQTVQVEGKKPIALKEFKSGHPDFTLTW
ncbi:MAG: methionyl-tRNA formyltransferase [bacterium]|nr:methionyl-tRNA formyltransferase [bacterium]